MFNARKERSCFIIGPMKDMALRDQARLVRLAREVVRPILDGIERSDAEVRYKVQTPYDLGGDNIMQDVIHAIDRADIVIADLTDNNPNVFYELGITHALGRPCITVMEERQVKVEFDIQAYRVRKINLEENRYSEARDTLRGPLERAHQDVDWSRFENPVIDFFRAPITYISPAFSLAQGYYYNFVEPVVEAMMLHIGTRYIQQISIEKPSTVQEEENDILPDDIRKRLRLYVVVPDKIYHAKHVFVDKFRDQLPRAVIEGKGRSYTCFYRAEDHALIDIPTTIRQMEDAVKRRMRYDVRQESKEWIEVESQEIDRFLMNLILLIDSHRENPAFKNLIRLVRYNPDNPTPDLWWLHEIFDS